MRRVSRIGIIVMLVALVMVMGLVPGMARAQDGPEWMTYTFQVAVGTFSFDAPAAWGVEGPDPAFFLADSPEALTSPVEGDHFLAMALDPGYLAQLYQDTGDLQSAVVLYVTGHMEEPYASPVATLRLNDDTVLAVDTSGPEERAFIARNLGDDRLIKMFITVQPGNLVLYLDDLIAVVESMTLVVSPDSASAAPEDDPFALTGVYIPVDKSIIIHTPAGWATHPFNPGTILFGNGQEAIDRLIERGQIAPHSTLFTLVTPPVVSALMEDALTPDTTPDEVLAFFTALSNATDAYGEIELVMVGDYPAARAFLPQSHFQIITYAVQIAPGQFALFDLMVDGRAFEQHQPLLEAIMASAEVAGE
jgi:hypothetical protein